MRKILSPAFIIVFLLQSLVFSGDAIAVNELGASGISESEAVSLTDALRVEIGKTGKYEVMERSKMNEILKEQGFQQSGVCDDESCALEMGKLLSVKYVVLGNIGKVGKTYTLNIRMVEVKTGKIIADVAENHKGSIDDLLTEKIPIAAKKLSGTYKEKKRKPGIIIAISAAAVAAITVPVVYFATQDDEEKTITSSDITVIW